MVQSEHDGWQRMGELWISNGEDDCQGHIELKVQLEQIENAEKANTDD